MKYIKKFNSFLLEGFKNFSYSIPNDNFVKFVDYYILSFLPSYDVVNNKDLSLSLKEAKEKCYYNLKEQLTTSLYDMLVNDYIKGKKFEEENSQFLIDKAEKKGEKYIPQYNFELSNNKKANLYKFREIAISQKSKDTINIIDSLLKLDNENNLNNIMVYINKILDVAHRFTDVLSGKNHMGNPYTFKKFLDFRQNYVPLITNYFNKNNKLKYFNDLMHTSGIYQWFELCSIDIKTLAAAVLKDVFGISYDSFLRTNLELKNKEFEYKYYKTPEDVAMNLINNNQVVELKEYMNLDLSKEHLTNVHVFKIMPNYKGRLNLSKNYFKSFNGFKIEDGFNGTIDFSGTIAKSVDGLIIGDNCEGTIKFSISQIELVTNIKIGNSCSTRFSFLGCDNLVFDVDIPLDFFGIFNLTQIKNLKIDKERYGHEIFDGLIIIDNKK